MSNSSSLYAPFFFTVLAIVLLLLTAHWLLISRNPDLGNERKFPRQLVLLGLTFLGVLLSVLVFPTSDSSRNQLIGLIGIITSGVLAFSSTTIISNLMAGLLLRITKPFKVGDFIRVGDQFGRVSERGLFDTEIQTETSELIALPSTYCIRNPVATIRSSGTIISASLSLGYDLDHNQIESLLIEAAHTCGLKEPFVHILELGNFAVTYRVSGLLKETKRIISMRSNLYGQVLEVLHHHGIEILSPTYMTQRRLSEGTKILPTHPIVTPVDNHSPVAEDIAFDKAEQAEIRENRKQELIQEIKSMEEALKKVEDDKEKNMGQEALERKREELKSLEEASGRKDTKH